MAHSVDSHETSSLVASYTIPDEAILNAQCLATQYSLPPSHVLRSAAAIVASIYNYSDIVTQATATIAVSSQSPPGLTIDHIKILGVEVDQNRNFLDLARSVSDERVNAEANISLPTKKLLEQHQAVGTLVCFYETSRVDSKSLFDVRFESEWGALLDRFNCNIAICLPASPSMSEGMFIHKSTKSSAITPLSLATTFAKILSSASRRPTCDVGELDCLGEQDETLVRRRNELIAQPQSICLHEIISNKARMRPRAPAVCAADGTLTHRELDSLSTQLAISLVKKGVRKGSVIPLCFEKSQYMIVSFLAVLKTGAACTMLEASLPTERLLCMIRQVSARFLLSSCSQVPRFRTLIDTIEIGQAFFDRSNSSELCDLPTCHPSDTAIILFTSGSTGSPKGMLHEHVTINTSLNALARRLKLDESTRIAQFAAYSFDLSMIEILLPLVVGGCVCVPSENSRLENLSNCMEEMSVNFAMLTPSSVKLLRPLDIPSMRMIMVGGEPITGETIHVWEPHVDLINGWGTAECGICSCVVVDRSVPTSIGTFMEMGAWIVDPYNTQRLLPIGAVGELIVEGPQVARGYLDEPEKTSASFIKSPPWLKRAPRGRLYRTGDLMRYMSDASMEYCGRRDLQVKIRGCRIELGEVEYHITAHDLVANAMVTVPKQGIHSGKLVAIFQLNQSLSHNHERRCSETEDPIIVAAGDNDTLDGSINTIIDCVESKLSHQSVPNKWIVVNCLPITSSDKVDRKKMNAWLGSLQKAVQQTPHVDGTTAKDDPSPMLRKVSRIVVDAIAQGDDGYDERMVKPDSRLKALGVDSISVIDISAAIQEEFEVRISIKVLLDSSLNLISLVDLIQKYISCRDAEKYPSPSLQSDSSSCSESCKALEDFRRSESQLLEPLQVSGRRVFLTGATGYVGSYILRSLLAHSHIDKVYVLVRARTKELALARIVAAAKNGKWWDESLMLKLDVWPGDLSQPNLGLSEEHLSRLRPSPERAGEAVNAIVHNGATVHWLADYEELRPTNVASTVQLLDIVRRSTSISKFVFVASDPESHFETAHRDDEDLANHLSQLSGYRQTKAVSEMLVRSMASATESASRRFSWIKPGFIVGSQEDGVANVDDFLWRLAASVVRLGAYDSHEATGWIYVASVDATTDRVLKAVCDEPERARDNGAIVDGMDAQDFWKLLEKVSGCPLKPVPHDEWLALLRRDVFQTGKQHPLWPLLHLLEDENLTLRSKGPAPAPALQERTKKSVSHIVQKGMVYLDELGFFSHNTAWSGEETSNQVFQRKKRSRCWIGQDECNIGISESKRVKKVDMVA
ncbi:MAG: putative NRPS-like protein biosynthetic cluster [Candelaria pacifica]|nr:MAG: putative NRPS-like protein biosynthetic cluster [Candelaria pacifica]